MRFTKHFVPNDIGKNAMAKGAEGKYIDKIHRQLSKDVYSMKMNMGMGSPGGVPDYYYEGDRGTIWVEYKAIKDWDKKRTIPWSMLSALQREWLLRAHLNGRIVALLIGDEQGRTLWLSGYDIEIPSGLQYYTLLTKKEAAYKIGMYTLCNPPLKK